MDYNDLFGENENRPGLDEGGHNRLGEDENQTIVEENVGVNNIWLGNEGANESGLGNEEGDVNLTCESEDSALDIRFDDSEDEVGIGGNLDSEVGGNEVNESTATLNKESLRDVDAGIEATVNAKNVVGEGSGVRENEATVNEATVQTEYV